MRARPDKEISIWWFAFGYFAAYAPYSALTKALSKGMVPGVDLPVTGTMILPVSAMASLLAMAATLTALGWWRFLPRRPLLGSTLSLPLPNRWTLASGLCTAVIIVTTTLAYTFEGISIVFVMLLMRGGMLITAPVVDALTKRKVRWFSWSGLLLSLGALVVAFTGRGGFAITLACAIDVLAYLGAYFIRLRFMSRLAKSPDQDVTRSYFVQEQVVATPAVVLVLGVLALIGHGDFMMDLRRGFIDVPASSALWAVALIGLFSQGTGVFGGLILLGKQENTYCVPVNRCSSVLAGVIASYLLVLFTGASAPAGSELLGAGLIITAILFLTIPPMLEKRGGVAAPLPVAEPEPAKIRLFRSE